MDVNRVGARISLPPVALVVFSIASMQLGAAFAKLLFSEVGPAGMVFMRVGFAAIILFTLFCPKWIPHAQLHFWILLGFGIALTLMNLSFYAAIERIPIGIAATLEFMGPLGLAALKSRRRLDLLWIFLALSGVLLLAPIRGEALDIRGVLFALAAAFCWAMYILLAAQVGQAVPGVDGLCWAMVIAAVLLAPIGIASAGSALLKPKILGVGFIVAMLSSLLPYSLELIALKSMPINVFGVLKSLEPMFAAIAGLLVLGETLTMQSTFAIALVSLAAAAARFCNG